MPPDVGPEEPSGLLAELGRTAEEIRRGERRQRVRRGLLVALFTVAASTLAAEAWLRISGRRQAALEERLAGVHRSWVELSRSRIFEPIDDPLRRYAMRPGASCEVGDWHFGVSSHRTRGTDFPLEKPANEKRLLCIGDSFAFGMWCDDGETLVEELARYANEAEERAASGVHWRAINLGVPGYHSGQQARAFEEDGLPLAPDAVVIYFNSNDIEQEGFFYAEDLGVLRRDFLPLPAGLRERLWRTSHLYGWIASMHARGVESGETPYLDPRVPFAHVREDNRAYTRDALQRIVTTCEERALPVFFVHQPLMSYMGDARDPAWGALELVQWGEELRAELGVPGVCLLGWMRGYADGVDRLAGGAPPEFLLDTYFADERIQDALGQAKERARALGKSWEECTLAEQVACFEGMGGPLDPPPDFHLSAEGYAHIGRIVYPLMREAGVLP